ncbi:MAG TPA: archease [Burkholderiales bacterium]
MQYAPPEHPAYFDHDADIGIVGRGPTLERCLESAAEAVFAIMAGPCAVEQEMEVAVEFQEPDPEFALVTWINLLLAAAREHGLALCRFELAREDDRWRGRARGAPWRKGQERGTEVKGATLTMLSVKRDGDGWEARCVVDV